MLSCILPPTVYCTLETPFILPKIFPIHLLLSQFRFKVNILAPGPFFPIGNADRVVNLNKIEQRNSLC